MMWLTTMSPESRRLIKVLPTDAERTAAVFDLLLGDNLQGRKEHIAEHGAEYLDDLDVADTRPTEEHPYDCRACRCGA